MPPGRRWSAYDPHPEYLSSKYARGLSEVDLIEVQHHHAHIASCLVDNGETGPVIGVAFDGLGYGIDATLWGGEFLAVDLAHSRRLGHLAPVALPGGTAAVREPWRMVAAYLPDLVDQPTARRNAQRWSAVVAVSRTPRLSPLTSSAGRLFDAVSALVTGRDVVTYEGQAAIELEQIADHTAPGSYHARLVEGAPFQIVGADLVAAVVSDLDAAVSPERVAMRFHRGVATSIADGCELARQRTGLSTVALSGGVFQNVLLLGLALDLLVRRGFRVLTHRDIPPNDGGISLGQAAVAAEQRSPATSPFKRIAGPRSCGKTGVLVQNAWAVEGRTRPCGCCCRRPVPHIVSGFSGLPDRSAGGWRRRPRRRHARAPRWRRHRRPATR